MQITPVRVMLSNGSSAGGMSRIKDCLLKTQLRRVLYTVVTGEYEVLNESEISDPGVHAICFTDSPDLVSATWEVVQFTPSFARDPIRSQRLIKILGHSRLDEYDEWLYIDNTVRLTVAPSVILDEWLKESDLAIPTHSYRESTRDEFAVVQDGDLDSYERLEEQLHHYQENFECPLEERPLWTAIIARRPTPLVRDWAETWAKHVLRYSRRDQLSVTVALEISQLEVNRIQIDNFLSPLHQWPILNDRKVERRSFVGRNFGREILKLEERNLELKNELEASRNELEASRNELEASRMAFTDSFSWKVTKPLRAIRRTFAPRRN
jgi:hypothetical protein